MLSFSLQKEFEQNYFDGNWLMYGYTCNGKEPKVEKCNCVTSNGTVICTKTLGDDCVTTGHETFRFKLPALVETGKNVKLTYVVGSPQKPNAGHWRNKFQVVDLNLFVSQSRKYTRDPLKSDKPEPAPVEPKPVPVVDPVPVAPVEPKPVPVVDPVPVAPVEPKPVAPVEPVPVSPPRPTAITRYVYYYNQYFIGGWNAVGYICNKNTPQIEKININYVGKSRRLAATKVTGDECIPAGNISFNFIAPQKIWQGETIPITFQIGAPGKTERDWVDRQIYVIDLNSFRIENRIFYRNIGPNNHPNGVYINMHPLIGHGAYPGPANIKVNPKNLRNPVRRFVIVEESISKPGNC
jgi:hypothetical protein